MRKNKSGFNRNDIKEDESRMDLIPTFALRKVGVHYGNGAKKFGERNWEKANSLEDLTSFKASAFRHFTQYLDGEDNEDHFSACIWNLIGMEHVKRQLK